MKIGNGVTGIRTLTEKKMKGSRAWTEAKRCLTASAHSAARLRPGPAPQC